MKKNGPWTIKDSEVKYENPWIKVREDRVIRPDGTDGIYGTVHISAGVSVLPVDSDGFAYLINEFAYAQGDYEISVVSGARDEGEEFLAAAQRELREELGILAETWTALGKDKPLTSYTDASNHLFLAQGITADDTFLGDLNEPMTLYKIPLADAVSMVMNNEITGEVTALLILKTHLFLNSKGV